MLQAAAGKQGVAYHMADPTAMCGVQTVVEYEEYTPLSIQRFTT